MIAREIRERMLGEQPVPFEITSQVTEVRIDPQELARCTDLVGHIQRVLRHAQRLEESVETAVQLHFASNAHRTNDVMRTLTTITAIFMPLTLVTGIFGMNFEFIPGTHARFGFLLTVGCMALIALALVVWFRARRYLSSPYEARRWQRRRQGPRDTAAPHPPEP